MDIDRIDHPIVLTTRLDDLATAYQSMGFTLTPRSSRHRGTDPRTGAEQDLGTANRHVVFRDSSIELLGLLDRDAPDPWGAWRLVEAYEGVRGIIFGCADVEATHRRLGAAGVPVTPILDFQREVATPEGEAILHARAAHLLPPTPEGGLGIAQHLTLELVRQPRYMAHPNGTLALAAVTLVVADEELDAYLDRYRVLLAVEPRDGAFPLRAGRVEIVPVSALDDVLPGETAPTLPFLAALTVAVADLATARAAVAFDTHAVPGGFLVRAEDAGGASVVFTEAR